MTPDAELSEMQREWRASVASSIRSTEDKVDLLLKQMSEMRVEYVRFHHFEAVSKRVAALEGDKQKIIGAAVLLNALGALVLYLISKFWK
jgi:hypothetical protein